VAGPKQNGFWIQAADSIPIRGAIKTKTYRLVHVTRLVTRIEYAEQQILLDARAISTATQSVARARRCRPRARPVESSLDHQPYDRARRLEVHRGLSGGWPRILSNLKSLLETGQIILS